MGGGARGVDFISDGDVSEFDVTVVSDIVLDPCIGVGLAGSYVLKGIVGDAYHELNDGASKGLESGLVGIVQSHSSDVVLVVESYHLSRRRQVVTLHSVTHSRLGTYK